MYHVFSQLITPCECKREQGGGALKEALGLADGASGDGTGAAQILLLKEKVEEKAASGVTIFMGDGGKMTPEIHSDTRLCL